MFKFYKGTEIDFDKYESYLRYRPYIVFDREKMTQILHYEECREETLAALAIDTMLFRSGGHCSDLSRNVILNYLMDYENCPERYFHNHKTQSASLDSKKVLEKLLQNNHAVEFLTDYMRYKSLVSKNGKIKGIIKNSNQDAGHNRDNVELTKLFFNVNQQKNLRYNYKDSDIIAIPKEYNSCISVDNGYFLAWGDFGQSDFRIAYNLFMRSPEHDEIMNAYDDKYEALARMVIGSEGKLFDYDQFKEERQLYKKLTLATVYGTRASAVPSEQPFIDRLTEFLRQCPKYMEYNKRLNDRVDIGLPIAIDSYFGNSQIIAGKYRDVDIINDALNAPVQTGTSEIVALTTMQILEEFYNRGYSEEDISVYYVRHDEPVFRVSEKALKDAWIFNQFNQILIDDWTPLRMDFNFGYYYKQQDEKLENIIKECYKDNANKIVNIKVGNTINNFYPVPPVCSLTVSKTETADNKIVYCLFSEELNGAHYKLLNSKPESEENYVFKIISDLEEQIYRKGYRGILVKASFVNTTESFIGNSYIQLRFVNDNTLSKSQLLSDFMAIKYSIKNKIDYSRISLPYKEDEAFIKTVKDFTDVMK